MVLLAQQIVVRNTYNKDNVKPMDNYLLLQKNSSIFLFLHYPDRYHIISVNKQFTDEKEEKLLSGTCSDAVIDEMGLTRTTILKQDLRGVAIGGCEAGSVLVLHTKDKKLKYVLSDDSSEESMSSMFGDIERFKAPKNSGSKTKRNDWRKDLQVESHKKPMKIIGYILNVLGFLSGMGAALFGYSKPLYIYTCFIIPLITAIQYFCFQQYYTLMGSKAYSEVGYTAKVTNLTSGLTTPIIGLVIFNLTNYHYPDWMPIIIGSVAIMIPIGCIFFFRSREVRENRSFLVEIVLVCTVFIHGYICQINHMANHQVEFQRSVVTDLRKVEGGRHADRYYVAVILDDNTELELPIARSEYNAILPGDSVNVFYGKGALGIEYAYLAGYQE